MRISEVKSAIVTAIESITVDASASPRDTFVHVDTGGRDLERAPDRVFRVWLSMVPTRGDFITLDSYLSTFSLAVYYVPSPGVEDRIGEDAERITDKVLSLHQTNGSIYRADIEPGSVLEIEQFITANFTLNIQYRLTGV